MAKTYEWKRDTYAGWVCNMPGNITLAASPRRTTTRNGKLTAAPKSAWSAQCSVWDEATRTMSRFGRDAWRDMPETAEAAKRLAQTVYEEATANA